MAHTALQKRLRGPVADALKKELKIENMHALPGITRVVVNVGLNQRKYGTKDMQEFISETLAKITGQKPSVRRARIAVSNFGIRQGLPVGLAVTLNGKSMYHFLDRLVSYALPRVRDFQGLNDKFDGHGNYSIGIKDQSIFPEVPAADANKIFGMQIQISTSAGSDEKARALLKEVGFPFRRKKDDQKNSSSPSA